MKRFFCTLVLSTLGVGAAKADTISIVLDQTVLYGAPNSMVNFTGTITNLTSAPVYFNGGSGSYSATTGYGVAPMYPNLNVPLAANASSGDQVLLQIDVPATPDHSVTFSETLYGGSTPTANDNLGTYTVTVTSGAAPAPEIDPSLATSGLVLLAGAIAVLRGRRIRRAA